jgi:hypothetical protein
MDLDIVLPEQLTTPLSRAMNTTEILTRDRPRSSSHGFVETLVGRVNALKVHIYLREHAPPHFTVKCSEGSARFRLDDGTRLQPDRGLAKYDTDIRNWYRQNRRALIERWNSSRPSDCPVGPLSADDA